MNDSSAARWIKIKWFGKECTEIDFLNSNWNSIKFICMLISVLLIGMKWLVGFLLNTEKDEWWFYLPAKIMNSFVDSFSSHFHIEQPEKREREREKDLSEIWNI